MYYIYYINDVIWYLFQETGWALWPQTWGLCSFLHRSWRTCSDFVSLSRHPNSCIQHLLKCFLEQFCAGISFWNTVIPSYINLGLKLTVVFEKWLLFGGQFPTKFKARTQISGRCRQVDTSILGGGWLYFNHQKIQHTIF